MHFELFPSVGLDSSLITAVLIGLYARFVFTESFGWVFSGLVVPGYLASVAVVLPVSAAVTVVEAALTLGVVAGISALLSATRLGTPAFGRDRFLWLVVASIAVRLVVEGALAQPARRVLPALLGIDLSRGFGFYGVGLVLVPLLANSCWKPGLARGFVQSFVITAMTYACLRVLLATTNLSLGSLELSFERIALDFAASPKAYVLLLAGALLASRFNLRFGWDTSGVMIAGLLSLGWFSPRRVLSTLVQALLLAGIAALLTRLPRIREWNVEGPRRIVLVFSIAYLLEFAVLHLSAGHATARDLFGMGYLLSSLLAVKIWQRRNPALVLVPALTLSLLGMLVGSLTSYGLMRASAAVDGAVITASTTHAQSVACAPRTSLRRELWVATTRVPHGAATRAAPRIGSAELARLEQLVHRLRARAGAGCQALGGLRDEADALGLVLADADAADGHRYLVLREGATAPEAVRGFGLVAFAEGASGTAAALVAAHPHGDLSDPDVLYALASRLRPAALLVGALGQGSTRGDPQVERDTPLRAVAASVGVPVLSLADSHAKTARLSRLVPSALVVALEAQLGPVRREGFGGWDAELRLPPALRASLVAPFEQSAPSLSSPSLWQRSGAQSPVRAPLTAFELKLWADDVLRPLLASPLPEAARSRAQRAGRMLELSVARSPIESADVLGFGSEPAADGGMIVWSTQAPGAPLVECASELSGVAELSGRLAAQLGARALLIDGHTPVGMQLTDAARAQVALGAQLPPLLAVVSARDAEPTTLYLPYAAAWRAALLTAIAAVDVVPVVREHLDDRTPVQLRSLFQLRSGALGATLSLSQADRERFVRARLSEHERELLARLTIPVLASKLDDRLQAACRAEPPSGQDRRWLEAFVSDAERFARDRSPALLAELARRAAEQAARLEVVEDPRTGDAFAVVHLPGESAAVLLRSVAKAAKQLSCASAAHGDFGVAVGPRASALIVSSP